MKDPTFWILARASGLTAYVLLTTVVVAGLVLKSRPFRSLKPAAAIDVHRFLTMLALGALAVHATALVLDSTIRIGPGALVIPGLAPYRPVWTGAGVLAAELALVIAISFPLRRRIGVRNWRRLHWATYAVFALATAHGLFAGTDSSRPAVFDLYLGAVAAVAFATAWRALAAPVRPSPVRPVPVPVPRSERST
jgi:sulfoxide reductase heme-binding subunit YedZ